MKPKKLVPVCFIVVLTAVSLVLPALAHGHGHHNGPRRNTQSVQTVQTPAAIAVCPVQGCTLAGRHSHSGVTYCGYAHESGFCDGKCRALCTVEDCDAVGPHSHNGTLYCGYDHETGFCDGLCRALCSVEGCAVMGRHTHSGTAYCGYDHETGFCDGHCQALCSVAGCTTLGQHSHYGTAYCGYRHESGFCDGNHAVCAVAGQRTHWSASCHR